MGWVLKDQFSDRYFSKFNRFSDDISVAEVYATEADAVAAAFYLKKLHNSEYATYLVLYGNGKWDPSWTVPKEVHLRPVEVKEDPVLMQQLKAFK